MKKLVSLYLVLMIFFNSLFSQVFYPESSLTWSKERKLDWKDFKGEVDKNSKFAALVTSSIVCQPYFNNDSLMIRIESLFAPEKSWKKGTEMDSFALTHEQTHFNITELFSRKLRRFIHEQLTSSQKEKTENVLIKIESKFNELTSECGKMQDLYDEQTRHSLDRSEQEKWNSLVWKSLGELDDWTMKAFYIEGFVHLK